MFNLFLLWIGALIRLFRSRGEVGTRRIAHCNVTANPTATWTLQQFREVMMDVQSCRFVAPTLMPLPSRIGTLRREYLDHMLFWTTADLEKLLEFRTCFNNHCTHTSLEGQTPDTPVSRPIANLRSFRWQPHCRNLYQTPMAA